MTTSLQDQIVAALRSKPDQKAADLARALNVDKTDVNRALYGPLKRLVAQDRAYRWSVVETTITNSDDAPVAEPASATDLAKLCRYYLACLGYDDTGVSVFQTSQYGDPDYFEVNSLPRSPSDLADRDGVKKLLGRKRSEQGRYGLFFGYPTSLRLLKSKRSNWEGRMVEPVLLFPIEHDGRGGQLTVDLGFPIVNQKVLQNFTNVERDALMNELVQLEQELGLGSSDSLMEIDELAMRLQAIRPEWPWQEQIEPNDLSSERTLLSALSTPGIYNRAVVVMAEKSPFTQGLEKELRDLAALSKHEYENTALGRWLAGHATTSSPKQLTEPLIAVLPMNSEQGQAVASALTRPITIITGPPGTGKSQVVTNLLINAAWAGKRVLLASKNNKAVDVVETRVNALGPRPILVRVGAQSYQVRLAEYVLALLSSLTTEAERQEFAEAKIGHERLVEAFKRITDETHQFVQRRNEVDRLEQATEEVRHRLGDSLFAFSLNLDVGSVREHCRASQTQFALQTKPVLAFLRNLYGHSSSQEG